MVRQNCPSQRRPVHPACGMDVGGSAIAPTTAINVQAAGSITARLSGDTLRIMDATGTIASIVLSNTTGLALNSAHANWKPDATLGGTDVFLSNTVCFAAGTRIMTETGERPVESLAPGDGVITADGDVRRIKWIGQRSIDLRAHPRPQLAAPVRVRRDAVAPGRPRRDLLLSPDHCLFQYERLIPVKRLINGMTIVQERQTAAVQYFHVELERHGLLLAEGVAAESYLDTGNRGFFANAGAAVVLHPDFAGDARLPQWNIDSCAPLATERADVEPAWQALVWRAATLGYRPPKQLTTTDPDLRLLADGRRIPPLSVHGALHLFVLPPRIRSLRLVSRSDIPADHDPLLDDFRRLGVRIDGIALTAGVERTDLPLDHPHLQHGWHPPERQGAALWRWTEGDAELPLLLDTPAILELRVGGMSYALDAAAQPDRRRSLAA